MKWVEDRYEALAASLHAKEIICELELATKADGTLPRDAGPLRRRRRRVRRLSVHAPHRPALRRRHAARTSTTCRAVRFEVDAAFTNKCPSGAYRGVGWTSGQTAREALVDEAARELGIDPIELRLQNTIPDGEPYVSATGLQVRRRELRRGTAQGDGARRLRRASAQRQREAARARAATSASASAPSSSRAAGPGELAEAHGLPVRLPRLGPRHDRAGRVGRRRARPALARPGAPDDDGAGRRRQALGADREREDRPGRHGADRLRGRARSAAAAP